MTATVHNAIKLDWKGYEGVPEHTQRALERYVELGYFPGGFLTAVLCNDLFGAVGQADEGNIVALPLIVKFVYNRMPGNSWGSKQKMYDFVEQPFYDRLSKVTA